MKSGSSAMDLFIAAHRENGSLILQVSDSGSGFGEIDPSGVFGRGLGLSNIRDRLAHLYGDRQQFSISNRGSGGAQVTLSVPAGAKVKAKACSAGTTLTLRDLHVEGGPARP